MLSYDGKLSIYCFLGAFLIVVLSIVELFCKTCSNIIDTEHNIWWLLPAYFVLVNIFLRIIYRGFAYQVAIRSVFLGTVFAIGIYVIIYAPANWDLFGWYLCVMSFFHYSEFLAIAWCNPITLSVDSFILNHSAEYGIAAVASWIEYAVEAYFYPAMKSFYVISWIGFALCFVGEILRKTAMITARMSFSHLVRTEKEDDHELVTHGVYSVCRHPSYVGWFYWSIGTQILLLNPFCAIAYTIASWSFFRERITNEEQNLLYFFGRDYMDYQRSVGTGLPGIPGYLIED